MTYICMACGSEIEYEAVLKNKLKCTKCKEKRSNIWIKKRPTTVAKTVMAR